MKWAFQIKYKIRAAVALAAILLTIILGNFFMRNNFLSLDQSMSSMYDDRLKPSAYIYEISNNLYQKKLLQNEAESAGQASVSRDLQRHDAAIASLITSYEQTYLTEVEKQQWQSFRHHLNEYHQLERTVTTGNGMVEGSAEEALLNKQFILVQNDLNALSKIQVAEGSSLQKNTHSIVNRTSVISMLEMSLLIVLGLFSLVLLSVSDRSLFKQYEKDVRLN